MPVSPVPAHDLWTALNQLQDRLATATPDEETRLAPHATLLRQRLAQCGPVPTLDVAMDGPRPPVDLDAQWQAILAEAQGVRIEAVPEATVSRPMARTFTSTMAFSEAFLALGDLPADLRASGVAEPKENPAETVPLTE